MRPSLRRILLCLLLVSGAAQAQTTINDREVLASDRPEAWAMNQAAATTFMSALGELPPLAPGHWDLGLEVGEIPRLSARQRQVGFNGFKTEDLNKSPVFGRLRLLVGLGHGWVGEFAYTPPLRINGTQARGLVAAAIGRRWFEREHWSLASRLFGQHGSVVGDITCPGELAGVADPQINPYGCQAASRDRVRLNYYGADLFAAGHQGAWSWQAGAGVVRSELSVHLDALTDSFRDRTLLSASGHLHYVSVGIARAVTSRWQWGLGLIYVPLAVKRDPQPDASNEAMTSIRVQLLYHGN